MGKALGKVFFSKKKQPASIKLGALLSGSERGVATVGKRIVAARNRTYLVKSHGTCLALRVARTSMTPQQVGWWVWGWAMGSVDAEGRRPPVS